MADDLDAQAKLRAEALVPPTPAGSSPMRDSNRDALVRALTVDLRAEVAREVMTEERLAKVEAQTRGLAKAVMAIADPLITVALVQDVKDEMVDVPPIARDPGTE
jgi:hypothetical protein